MIKKRLNIARFRLPTANTKAEPVIGADVLAASWIRFPFRPGHGCLPAALLELGLAAEAVQLSIGCSRQFPARGRFFILSVFKIIFRFLGYSLTKKNANYIQKHSLPTPVSVVRLGVATTRHPTGKEETKNKSHSARIWFVENRWRWKSLRRRQIYERNILEFWAFALLGLFYFWGFDEMSFWRSRFSMIKPTKCSDCCTVWAVSRSFRFPTLTSTNRFLLTKRHFKNKHNFRFQSETDKPQMGQRKM